MKLNCIDEDTCALEITYDDELNPSRVVVYKGVIKDSLAITVNLSAFNETSGRLDVQVTDKSRQFIVVRRKIYIVTSPLLNEIFVAGTKIMDFNYNKLFTLGDDELSYPRIIDIPTKQQTTIPLKVQIKKDNPVYLTPYGAVIAGVDSSRYPDQSAFTWGYDWNAGNIYPLGSVSGPYSIKAAGDYLIWSNSKTLYRRNLRNRTDTTVSTSAGNTNNDIAENGLLTYWSDNNNSYNIVGYQNGTNTTLTNNNGNKWNTYPLTDGSRIIYLKSDPCCNFGSSSIYLYDGSSHMELSNMKGTDPQPGRNYQLNNTLIAFTKLDLSTQRQIWLRNRLGGETQITFSGSNEIDLLTPQGDVIYTQAGRFTRTEKRFIYLSNGKTVEINRAGKAFYRDSSVYMAMGRSLFKLNVQTGVLPLKLETFTAEKKGNINLLYWLAATDPNTHTQIERSAEGITFNPIGRITGSNEPGLKQYRYTDSTPLLSTNYYRLKFISQSGDEFSQVRIVKLVNRWTAQIFPNPVYDHLLIRFESERQLILPVRIWSIDGKMVQSSHLRIEKGTNLRNINLTGLKPGNYFLKAGASPAETISRKFIKL